MAACGISEEAWALGSRAGKTQIRYLLKSLSSFDNLYIKFASQTFSLPTSKGKARVEVMHAQQIVALSSLACTASCFIGCCHVRIFWASHCNLMRQVVHVVYRKDN